MHKQSDLIGSAEAAAVAGVSRATWNRWASSGRIKPVATLPGKTGARLYSRADVERARDEIANSDDDQ